MSSEDQPSPPEAATHIEAIEVAAAVWLSLRDRGMTPEQTTEFVHWLQQDRRHQEIFDELDEVWTDCDALEFLPVATEGQPDPDILAPRARSTRRGSQIVAWGGLAAAAMVVLGLVLFQVGDQRPLAVTTQVGEMSRVELPDGTLVHVNTGSTIAATFNEQGREIYLTGESFFAVSPDAQRPFTVRAGPVVVYAVGTAFSVREHTAAVEVLVTEGQVRVINSRTGDDLLLQGERAQSAVPLLGPGERVFVALDATRTDVAAASAAVEQLSMEQVQQALAWQSERLVFDGVGLAEVVAEFNRYSERKLVIADDRLALKRFSGTFRTDGAPAFMRLLETSFGVVTSEAEGKIILRLAP